MRVPDDGRVFDGLFHADGDRGERKFRYELKPGTSVHPLPGDEVCRVREFHGQDPAGFGLFNKDVQALPDGSGHVGGRSRTEHCHAVRGFVGTARRGCFDGGLLGLPE